VPFSIRGHPTPRPGHIGLELPNPCANYLFEVPEICFGTNPIQAEKSRPDRKAFGSATLATKAVANAGPTPGSASSRLLVSLDRCQAMILRSSCKICVFSIRN
jgi:hypothetical protein